MTRMRTATDILIAGVMLTIGIFYVAKMLFDAVHLPKLTAVAAASFVGLGGLWLIGGAASGELRRERE